MVPDNFRSHGKSHVTNVVPKKYGQLIKMLETVLVKIEMCIRTIKKIIQEKSLLPLPL